MTHRKEWMRPPDSVVDRLRRGIEEFNARLFFECHETLEALWREELDPTRTFCQGLLQVAVGFHHLSGGNIRGARNLLARGAATLGAFRPGRFGIDVDELLGAVSRCQEEIERLGAGQIDAFDITLIPTIVLNPSNGTERP